MNRLRPLRLRLLCSTALLALGACGGGQPEIVRATAAQDLELVRRLVAEGADVNDRGAGGQWLPAIHYTGGNEELLGVLVDAGAEPDAEVLGQYALSGKTSAVKLLLDHGASIDGEDSQYGNTALHAAAMNGNLEVVQLLVERGADPSIRNQEGRTPYEEAAEFPDHPDRQEVMHFLEPDKHPIEVPEPSPGFLVLSVRFDSLVDHEGKRCVDLTLENTSGRRIKEFYGGISAVRASDREYLYSWGLSIGIADIESGQLFDTGWCPDVDRGAELLSLLESEPGSVEWVFEANRVVYGDGTEEIF